MFKIIGVVFFLIPGIYLSSLAQKPVDYKDYHRQMIKADQYIVAGRYQEALAVMDGVFGRFPFVFLRDYQVAAQVAAFSGNKLKTFQYLKAAAADGWNLTAIKRIKLFQKLRSDSEWRSFLQQYPALHGRYLQRLDLPLQKEIEQMFRDDQKLAAENLKITDDNKEDAFLMQRFVPQSERQIRQLHQLMLKKGYPGEKRIGDKPWASTILSHHNSVSPVYQQQDKLYPVLRPLLLKAISSGDLSPGDFAIIEDWRIDVGSDHKESSYGYIKPLTTGSLAKADRLREAIGLPSVALRNQLVDVQQRTGINFYMEGTTWVKGKMVLQKTNGIL